MKPMKIRSSEALDEGKKYVLLVDDDAVLMQQWERVLIAAGYEVATCRSPEHAIEACSMRWPDAIVVDAFFRDETGKPLGTGATVLCTKVSILAYENKNEMPLIIGVTASRPTEYFPLDVFAQVPKNNMPLRLRKPFLPSVLAQKLNAHFASVPANLN